MKNCLVGKRFDRRDRALVHGSTLGKDDMAMAAGIATLEVLQEEKLVERAAATGAALLAELQGLVGKHELLKQVRGKGLTIGLEFGPPKGLKLRAAWHLMDSARRGLFCQKIGRAHV